MFYDRAKNNRINKINGRALRLVYRDIEFSFDELLVIDTSISVHQRNLQLLMIEIYKTKNKLEKIHLLWKISLSKKRKPTILETAMVFRCQEQIQLFMVSKPYYALETDFGNALRDA